MKLFLLPVLCWTLATSLTFAQKQLPASMKPYMVHQEGKIQRILDLAGFEQPQTMEAAINPRSFDPVLDSTTTYTNYSLFDSIPFVHSRYSYPQENVEVIIDFTHDVDHWALLGRTTLISNEFGVQTDIIAELYDESIQNYVPESRLQVFPHGESADLVDSFFVSVWSVEDNAWKRQLANFNTYDEEDRLTESLSSIEFFEIPILFLDRYRYNSEGHLVQIDSYSIDSGEEFIAGRQEMTYQDGLLATATTLISDGANGFIPETKIEYRYTPNGQEELVNTYQFDFDKNDWKLQLVQGYVYDDQQRVTSIEVVKDEEGVWTRSKTDFEYKEAEFVSVESTYLYDNNAEEWVINERKFYYYQGETTGTDDPIIADAAFLYPNPTPGVVQLKLTGKISVHVYTLEGKLVKNFYLPPGEKTVDMSAFPAGAYHVMAKSDEDYYSGKLIIQ